MNPLASGLLAAICLAATAVVAFAVGVLGVLSIAGAEDRVAATTVTVIPAEPGPSPAEPSPSSPESGPDASPAPSQDGEPEPSPGSGPDHWRDGVPPGVAAMLERGGTDGLPPGAIVGSATTVSARNLLERLPIRVGAAEPPMWVPRPSAAVSAEQRCALVIAAVLERYESGLGIGPKEHEVLGERLEGPCGDELVQASLPHPVED